MTFTDYESGIQLIWEMTGLSDENMELIKGHMKELAEEFNTSLEWQNEVYRQILCRTGGLFSGQYESLQSFARIVNKSASSGLDAAAVMDALVASGEAMQNKVIEKVIDDAFNMTAEERIAQATARLAEAFLKPSAAVTEALQQMGTSFTGLQSIFKEQGVQEALHRINKPLTRFEKIKLWFEKVIERVRLKRQNKKLRKSATALQRTAELINKLSSK